MAKAVLTHAAGSIYDGRLDERYEFPPGYPRVIEAAVGDLILYHEPRRLQAESERTGGRWEMQAASLLNASGKLRLPDDPAMRPHPRFLDHHRRSVFKG